MCRNAGLADDRWFEMRPPTHACIYCKHELSFPYDGQAAQDPYGRLS